ncbi:transketolase [Thalassospira profundimaris]|uniref:Pyruvate dehydrogenase E1 component n=2 Tax=Thalassospira indica TaxID=1891279 RepID=A0ABM6XUX6_9PROT|nr:transketolase [Thalassospira indica]OAZ14721.1 transketolase [Thalassospira profundimaris]
MKPAISDKKESNQEMSVQDSAPEIGEIIEASSTADINANDLEMLGLLEKKVRWLSSWTIHNANHLRPKRDGIKVGGHQASCASMTTLMTALYFNVLRPQDRVAVKPHASPVFHAINYLLGRQTKEKLENFRSFGGAQSYPSRTKDGDQVDFSTGSVGLGAAVTNFAALTQDYLRYKDMLPKDETPGRMVALVGDAELDEGNIYEALLDTWKHDIRNVWWVIDYNRQSLDGMIDAHLFRIIGRFFRAVGWNVITIKYGRKLHDAFAKPGGKSLKKWLNDVPNDIYSALTFQGGAAWRKQITSDMDGDNALASLLGDYDDDQLHDLMTNLGGHCMEAVLSAFDAVPNDKPTVFIAYTVKGYGTPLQGHKDNHAGLMNVPQMDAFKLQNNVADGQEWDLAAGLDISADQMRDYIAKAPFNDDAPRNKSAKHITIPEMPYARTETSSTQEVFGKILNELAKMKRSDLSDRIVTTSPDVTVSTNLGGFVNQRGLFGREELADEFKERKVPSAQKWIRSPSGQHVELGIAENNLFLNLAALGLSHSLFGERLFPIGTLYDPFIARGLDALNYACYQDARFMVVATPSGITLAPEGGAHQSISTPMIGMGQPGLTSFEPSFGDELAAIMGWSFEHMQDPDGGSIYLRLSTKPLSQPERDLSESEKTEIISGGYWLRKPGEDCKMAIAYCGAMAPEAIAAWEKLSDDHPGLGLLAVTSTDRLYNEWQDLERARLEGKADGKMAHVENLLKPLASDARLVTVIDGHPAALAWLGGVRGHAVAPLGVNAFGQCGDSIALYDHYQIGTEAILRAAKRWD